MTTDDSNATGPITWVLAPLEVEGLIEACRTASEVVVDLETTGLDEFAVTGGESNKGVAARIVLASFTLPQEGDDGRWDGETPVTYVLPLSHPDSPFSGSWRGTLRKVLQEGVVATKRAVNNQNVKFDARWVYGLTGVDISELIVWDTQVGSHLLDERYSTRLKERAPLVFGIPPWNDFDLTYPGAAEEVPLIELGEYAARDTWWTWRLAQYQRQEMFIRGGGYPEPINDPEPPQTAEDYLTARLGQVASWVAMPTVASLTKMEQNGFRLDIDWARSRLDEEVSKRESGLDKMAEKYGQPRESASSAATSNWFKSFTSRAVEDDDLRVGAMTAGGSPQWNKAVLGRQARAGNEVAQLILDQRAATKLAEFLTSWLQFVRSDGKIHARYNVGKTVTGRLSASEPNMQQVTKILRPAFIPDEGYVLADFDFSQIELRVAAFVARCQPMIDAFNDGQDLHRLLGSYITKKPPEEVTPYERQKAKSANFGLLYMQSPEGYRTYAEDVYGVILTQQEAAQFHAGFFERWDGMKQWHEQSTKRIMADGYIVSPIGRVRRLPNIWSPVSALREEAARQGVNSPVQGLASDLMQMAAADIQGLLPGTKPVPNSRLVATVHDSIVAQLPADNWREPAAEIARRMERSGEWLKRLGVTFDVPIVADYSVGTRWSLDDVSNPVSQL